MTKSERASKTRNKVSRELVRQTYRVKGICKNELGVEEIRILDIPVCATTEKECGKKAKRVCPYSAASEGVSMASMELVTTEKIIVAMSIELFVATAEFIETIDEE